MINTSKSIVAAFLAAGFLSLAQHAQAADTTTQLVTFAVAPINEISVSGNPAPMTVNAAAPGAAPTPVINSSTTYAITTNESNRKITGQINTNMPTGVTLRVLLDPPNGAAGFSFQALTTNPVDLVTGITTLNDPARQIVYELSANSNAGVVPSSTRTVTFTILAAD